MVEGVETDAQATDLRGLGSEVMQGYLFGRPAPTLGQLLEPAIPGCFASERQAVI